jgi:phosphoserine phosphatase
MSAEEATEIARLAGATRMQRIDEHAWRIHDAVPADPIPSYCEDHRIDFGFVPEGRRFADLKLLAMDMDSTLITIECIDELGDFAGRKSEVAAITDQAMRGELDYAQSLRKRVALLAGLDESVLERVYAERLRERLGLDYTLSNRLELAGGKLTGRLVGDIVDADAKAGRFREVMRELGARREQALAMGDGANDLKLMGDAGYSIAFRAKPRVRAQASCALDWSGLDAVLNLFE